MVKYQYRVNKLKKPETFSDAVKNTNKYYL
jgi:hypothetical protein